jgi:hypothetical protein
MSYHCNFRYARVLDRGSALPVATVLVLVRECARQDFQGLGRSSVGAPDRPAHRSSGSGSAAFRTLHDHVPFGRAHGPARFSAAPLQEHCENGKFISHRDRDLRSIYKGSHGKTPTRCSVGMPSHLRRGRRPASFGDRLAVNVAGPGMGAIAGSRVLPCHLATRR